jgi:hypothetical protein
MANLVITAANVVPGSGAVIVQGTAGATITQGQSVYLDTITTGKWLLAGDKAATAQGRVATGIALNSATTGQPIDVQKSGLITIGATLVAGVAYYLSATAVAIAPVADLAAGDYPCLLGMATSTTVLNLQIQAPQQSL